ncbi:MAG: poly-gamma-glutamate synthase PgsB, partial [Chloroflexota bacterium]
MTGIILTTLILCILIYQWRAHQKQHEARIQQLQWRIHVNGIRGKSTVTRLIAGVLREGGYRTVAKTTGSAARIIHEDGNETAIQRQGAPTILEQVDIIQQHVPEGTEALVIECMAVNPLYQNVSQHQIVKGNITVITNVREDHQDVMGESLLEIADSLSNTIPHSGTLITAEDRVELRDCLEKNA